MNRIHFKRSGFTIVELLIVIVVIGILAAISIVSYTGIQGRARDTQRINDLKSIDKAIKLYATENAIFPGVVGTPYASSWELSHNGTGATDFLSTLKTKNIIASVPVDPKNFTPETGTGAFRAPSASSENWVYFYYRYSAGSWSCDPSKGSFYILGVTRMDTVPIGGAHPSSPGFSCVDRDWQIQGAWVTGGYLN